MKHGITTSTGLAAIDRSKVRRLVINYKEHLASLKAVRGDMRQSTLDHINMVSAYMAVLNEGDRAFFAELYGQEMNAHGMSRKIEIRQ